LEKNYNLVSI